MAKIEWKTHLERFRDPRLFGGFNKRPDGTWLIQVDINPRNGNNRFPEPGEEVIVPVKGEDHSFRVIERIYPPALPADPPNKDELYSWWTFEPVADSNSEESERLTSMKNKQGADIMNPGHQTPRYDIPFDQEAVEAPRELTEEDYASVDNATNQRVIEEIRRLRAEGVPMPEIMQRAKQMLDDHLLGKNASIDRAAMPNEHLGWYAN